MCGIAGIISKQATKFNKEFDGLVDALAKRGPDDRGTWNNAKSSVLFGHRRLSIIDLSADGHQPMEYENFHIVFNGEIYNFEELKDELQKKGHVFHTKSDTEVILVAYKEWGTDAFIKLRGMFAFALYDGNKDEVILVRDRFGIKPLYYYESKDVLVFASAVGALKGSGLVSTEEDERWRTAFMLFGYLPYPITTLKHVRPLDAGSYLVRGAVGVSTTSYYFDPISLFTSKKEFTKDEVVKQIRKTLEETVRLHLISDAPLGVFLSGGLDSSVLSMLASRTLSKPVNTLSIDFKEAKFSERIYREELVKNIRSKHREVTVSADDFFDEFKNIFDAMDQPSIDGVNTYFVSRVAKEEGLTVVLSGLGSDEQFFGYNHFKRARLLAQLFRLPRYLRSSLSLFSKLKERIARIEYVKFDGLLPMYLITRGLFSPSWVMRELRVSRKEIDLLLETIAKANRLDDSRFGALAPEDIFSLLELKFYLKGQLLKDSDFMSMTHSIEVRVPFLDNELVALLASIRPLMKFGAVNKELLVRATEDVLPRVVWDRTKMGFTFPFEEWLRNLPDGLISDKNRASFEQFKAGAIHWSRIWSSLILNR